MSFHPSCVSLGLPLFYSFLAHARLPVPCTRVSAETTTANAAIFSSSRMLQVVFPPSEILPVLLRDSFLVGEISLTLWESHSALPKGFVLILLR